MLSSWVKQATATTGTGTITLGAVADGHVSFDTVFNDGDMARYAIEDGNNREIGIGIYTASGTTLARYYILETLVSGTYDDIAPIAITLTGDAIVTISADAGAFFPNLTVRDGLGGSSRRRDPFAGSTNNSPGTYTADRLYLMPFLVPIKMEIDTIGIYRCSIAGAASTIARVGIYRVHTDGMPGSVVAEGSTDIAVDVTFWNSGASLASNVTLKPGMYWIAMISDGEPEILSYATNELNHPFTPDQGGTNLCGNIVYDITPGWSVLHNLDGVNRDGSDVYVRSPVMWAEEVNGI